MGNEQVCQVKLLLQLLEEVDDLGLDRDIKCGNWLIADDQLRITSQSPGDPQALALPSTHFVGKAIAHRRIQPYRYPLTGYFGYFELPLYRLDRIDKKANKNGEAR